MKVIILNKSQQVAFFASGVCSRSGFRQRLCPHPPSLLLAQTDHRSDSQRAAGSSRGILGDICGPAGRLGRQPCITAAAGGRDMRPDHQLNKHTGLYVGYSQADGMRSSSQLVRLSIYSFRYFFFSPEIAAVCLCRGSPVKRRKRRRLLSRSKAVSSLVRLIPPSADG